MSDLAVLIISENDRQFNQLAKAIQGVGVRDVVQVTAGEDALSWLGRATCDVCVLSHELPGKRNGLDLLLDIRSRRPELPVIMVSRSGSEKVAVGAFHGGVVDYVPITRGYENAVASLISQIKVAVGGDIMPTQIIPAGVQEQVLRLTYQNGLRVIGRHLDVQNFRRANILEVDGGFIVRATQAGSRNIETLEFVNQQFFQLLAAAARVRGDGERPSPRTNALLPTGYEDFLRAIGYQLDQVGAEAVTFSELDELAVVGGIGRVDESGLTRLGPIQWLFRLDDVAELLNRAYKRRRIEATSNTGGGILRRLTG